MYVVIGITGQTGSAAADSLLQRGQSVRALVRTPERAGAWRQRGVDLTVGDVADEAALTRAFTGAKGAYVMVPPQYQSADPGASYEAIARAVRRAAEATGLGHVVYLSSEGAHLTSGTGAIGLLHRFEQILAGTAFRTSALRATFFQENWGSVAPVAAAQGVLPSFVTDLEAKRAMVATADIGETAADLLLQADAPAIVGLEGPELTSPADAARAFSKSLGREVIPVVAPRESWVPALQQAGFGAPYAELLAAMYDAINDGTVRFSGEGEHRRGKIPLEATIAGLARRQAA